MPGLHSLTQKDFEASLVEGQEVRLRWKDDSGRAVVEQINRASISVRVQEGIGSFPVGEQILVKRVSSGRWCASKCVRPI
jgi:hypothetical protein